MRRADSRHLPSIITILIALLALCLAPSLALAQPEPAVTWKAVPRSASAKPGATIPIAVEFTHKEGFHSWPAKEVALPTAIDEFAIRTTLKLTDEAKGVTIAGIQWPTAHPGKVPDVSGEADTVTVPLYSDRAVAFVWIHIDEAAVPGTLTIPMQASYQACNATMCFPQDDPTFSVTLTIDPATTEPPAADWATQYPGLKPLVESAKPPEPPVAPPTPPTVNPAKPTPPTTTPPSADNTPKTSAPPSPAPNLFGFGIGGGLFILFLVSALGGALLNLTPCVLPIIPIKIMALTQHAGSHRRAMFLGLWMALGVVAFWVAIGLPVALVKLFGDRVVDPSQLIFGTWWVALGIGLIIAIMGLGIMGLFMIQLPQSVYAINPKADTAWGSFVFGVMAGVLGLPCFGFVAGGLLAGAAALPPTTILLVFTGLGVGMAAPYLILSAYPKLVEKIPRTGPASELVKQVMGLFLIAASVIFIAAGFGALIAEKPYVAHTLAWWVVAFFIGLAGLWLAFRTLQISKAAWPRIVMPLIGVAFLIGAVAFAASATETERQDYVRRLDAERALAAQGGGAGGAGSYVTGAWIEYTKERFDKARGDNKVIIIDFTADWCITCKFLKRTILDRDPVRPRLTRGDLVLLEVDLTSKSAPGWDFLRSLGQTGVPTLAIYGPRSESPIVHNAYTADTVLNAISRVERTEASTTPPPPPAGEVAASSRPEGA